MFARLRRTTFSFMAVVAAFAVYRVAAVPFLEPTRQIKRVAPVSPEHRLPSVSQNHLGGYARFFSGRIVGTRQPHRAGKRNFKTAAQRVHHPA